MDETVIFGIIRSPLLIFLTKLGINEFGQVRALNTKPDGIN